MDLQERIDAFAALGQELLKGGDELEAAIHLAYVHNRWFTPDNSRHMIRAIAENYLAKDKLEQWLAPYRKKIEKVKPKTIGITMAGNVPLVGFHDLLCVLITGHNAQVKLSSKDNVLMTYFITKIAQINENFSSKIAQNEMLKSFDAIIATGGNNTSRYFEYYFSKYPNVIRKNRNSIAILTGNETNEELALLGQDIFQYFGLGCRNVSKLYVPRDYELRKLFEALEHFGNVMQVDKYKNNYDYNRTLLLMNNIKHLSNDFIMLKESEEIATPVSVLHYQYYKNLEEVALDVHLKRSQIQCIVGRPEVSGKAIPFGKAQQPELWDYADEVNTVNWLIGLSVD